MVKHADDSGVLRRRFPKPAVILRLNLSCFNGECHGRNTARQCRGGGKKLDK